jgi:large subunit ribosomal protein L9
MKVILADDVETLGKKGDLVEVADGYARNYLVPKGLALTATRGALKQAELMQKARAEAEARAKEEAASKVAQLAATPVYISARSGEEGKLFGSVTNSDVARGIVDQLDQEIDRRDVILEEPIRALGSYQVEVKLHEEVNALVTVEVIAHDEELEP